MRNIKSKLISIILKFYYRKKFGDASWGQVWLKGAKKSFENSDLPISKRIWALRRGFYPYRIAQYGLTQDNYNECLSDRAYYALYPVNNKYKSWIDDKLTIKYVLKPFEIYLPEYYFHVLKKRNCRFLKLMDCPKDITADNEGILTLLKQHGSVAVKPTAGGSGIGFCKLNYADGKYFLNDEEYTYEQMCNFLDKLDDHLIIQYVRMHPDVYKLNPGSLNTIRVMLINEYGNNPYIATAFMRIGTKQSGAVDNTAQGGMFCKVDVETGRFYDGEKINNHIITPAPVHPDTGIEIEGILPHWQLVKDKLIEIANYIPQIEWMGFDIAITSDGFNIIEINSHQGLHRYHTYPKDVKEYFNRKLAERGIKLK